MEQTFEMGEHGVPREPGETEASPPQTARRGRTGLDDSRDLLAAFKEDMSEEVSFADVKFPNKHRPGYEMRFSTDLSQHTLDQWKRRCKIPNVKPGEPNIDTARVLDIALANLNTGILKDGSEITDSDGAPLTFRSPDFFAAFGAVDAADGIHRFMVRDGYVQAVGEALIVECGFGDEAAPDPIGG